MEKNHNKSYSDKQGAYAQDENAQQDMEDARIEDVNPDEETVEEAENVEEVDDMEKKVAALEDQLAKEKKEYLFLMAEFDNFRKRTLKEKSEIIKNAGENVLKGLLPIMDDFERGLKAAETTDDSAAMKEGMSLIYNKLKKYLAQNGVKEIAPADDTFYRET